jgi:hypothetical protein
MKNGSEFEKYYEINSHPFERLSIPIYTPVNSNVPLFKAVPLLNTVRKVGHFQFHLIDRLKKK